jgi:hypothetical protein
MAPEMRGWRTPVIELKMIRQHVAVCTPVRMRETFSRLRLQCCISPG